jgi:multicomponent Na+:H+ antiporter subunit B
MKTSIVKQITNIVLPFIQVFALYVMVFGHISPGGGFAGGSILGASLIMYRFINGSEKTDNVFKYTYMLKLACASLITYGILKGSVFVSSFFGMNNLIGTGTPGTILSGGFILPLNILVGLVVAITFYFIATLFEEGELENANFAE